jgi:hypothetical protein
MEQNEEKVSLGNNIKCLYSIFGCQAIVDKNNLEEHLKTNFDNHNKLLISYITKYKNEYDNRLNNLKKVKLEIEEKLEIINRIYDEIDKNKKGTKLIQLNDYDNRSISLNESSSYRESEDEEYEKTYTKKTKNRYAVNVYGDKIGYYIESNDKVYTNSYFLNEHKNSKNNLQKQKEIENKKKEILDKLSKTIPYPFNDN